ncbi:pyridoxamine 5'-phosphate oxidase family protein [Oceanicoccus sp. KOV_DT_Chl]|uniref:pyridoxamine 5'-phosphate oxidase family protein n=1 Tax=Oceanicoccus sp. KOV_DT_Chl TaxID=1904639 RepID=UPI000C79EA49|nr:pyridoxamine 5'-phosphate oxidase family protein [Oceanicoccus sp. KOV_DT_Chl]
MKIHPKSQWHLSEIEQFIQLQHIPIRLACIDHDDFPLVCSLWFYYSDGCFWSASHKNSHIIKVLSKNSKVAFEIATNDYPYKGVRGKATIEISKDEQGVLPRLIDRYLGNSNEPLREWLLSRIDDEYAIKIAPTTINAWDFSTRMEA